MSCAFGKENDEGIHKKGKKWILTMPEIDRSPSAEISLASSDLEFASC